MRGPFRSVQRRSSELRAWDDAKKVQADPCSLRGGTASVLVGMVTTSKKTEVTIAANRIFGGAPFGGR